MSIYRILVRLLSKHLIYHLIVPLLVGIAIEILIAQHSSGHEERHVVDYLLSKERLGLYGGILATYALISGYLLRKETLLQMGKGHIATLTDSLKDATGFFATSTIPLREWFEPNVQEYFSHIVKHQLGNENFRHERVLLFFTENELKNAREKYLDGHFAKPLATIHNNYQIKLGFLRRKDILSILRELTYEEKRLLGCYPWWMPKSKRIAEWYLTKRRRIRELDFALVRHADGSMSVFPFSKKGDLLNIKSLAGNVQPYERLMDAIRNKVFSPSKERRGIVAAHDLLRELD